MLCKGRHTGFSFIRAPHDRSVLQRVAQDRHKRSIGSYNFHCVFNRIASHHDSYKYTIPWNASESLVRLRASKHTCHAKVGTWAFLSFVPLTIAQCCNGSPRIATGDPLDRLSFIASLPCRKSLDTSCNARPLATCFGNARPRQFN